MRSICTFAFASLMTVALGGGIARADDDTTSTAPGSGSSAAPSSSSSVRGDDKGALGVGLILGEPTGITAKLYLKDDQALQAAVGTALIGGGLQIHLDYVFHPFILQSRDAFVLPFYIGPGIRVIDYLGGRGEDDSFALGLRAVAGIVVDFKTVPLDAFLEVAGVFEYEFKDGKGFGPALNFGGGARYYF